MSELMKAFMGPEIRSGGQSVESLEGYHPPFGFRYVEPRVTLVRAVCTLHTNRLEST